MRLLIHPWSCHCAFDSSLQIRVSCINLVDAWVVRYGAEVSFAKIGGGFLENQQFQRSQDGRVQGYPMAYPMAACESWNGSLSLSLRSHDGQAIISEARGRVAVYACRHKLWVP
jgi:hypothetical protein